MDQNFREWEWIKFQCSFTEFKLFFEYLNFLGIGLGEEYPPQHYLNKLDHYYKYGLGIRKEWLNYLSEVNKLIEETE